MFDERQMAEALISRCSFFHKSINPAIVVKPIKVSFNLPPLLAVIGCFTLAFLVVCFGHKGDDEK